MDDAAKTLDASLPRAAEPGSLDPRKLSRVPPPPMRVVHQGWFRDTVTERQASDLLDEYRQRRAAGA